MNGVSGRYHESSWGGGGGGYSSSSSSTVITSSNGARAGARPRCAVVPTAGESLAQQETAQRTAALKEHALTDFGSLLETGLLSDFEIEAGGKIFRTHRALLAARCSYFHCVMKPHTEEFQKQRLIMKEVSAQMMSVILSFIYTGCFSSAVLSPPKTADAAGVKPPCSSAFLFDLMSCLNRLQFDADVKDLVGTSIQLTPENACQALTAAETHDFPSLKSRTIDYICSTAAEVTETPGWKEMMLSHPNLVTQCFLHGVGVLSVDEKYLPLRSSASKPSNGVSH